jgi:hypothetical protein
MVAKSQKTISCYVSNGRYKKIYIMKKFKFATAAIAAILLMIASIVIPAWTAGTLHHYYGALNFNNNDFWLLLGNFSLSVMVGGACFFFAIVIVTIEERD